VPAQYDWDSFHDLQLAELMANVERDAEAELPCESGARSPLFLHPSELTQACPGARCDGMHFGAHFEAEYRCHSSAGLWCPFLSEYLRCNLPQLLGLKDAAAPTAATRVTPATAAETAVLTCLESPLLHAIAGPDRDARWSLSSWAWWTAWLNYRVR
jgi:hypothetical protein